MTFRIIKPHEAFSIIRQDGPVRVSTGGPGLRGLPGADGADGAPGADGADGADGAPGVNGADGAYAAGDTIAIPYAVTDYAPVQIGGASKRALIADLLPFMFFNMLRDGGRFAGTPEPSAVGVSAFTAPPYLTLYNGSTGVAGPKFIYNNTTNGGSAGALDADVDALLAKMRSPNAAGSGPRRYGPEFYLWKITQGAGTTTSITVGANTYYLSFTNSTVPIVPWYSVACWIKVISGNVAINVPTITGLTSYIDKVAASSSLGLTSGDGWKHLLRTYNYGLDSGTNNGYLSSSAWSIFAQPGAEFYLALPVAVPGNPFKGRYTGVVPHYGVFG